MTAIMKKWILLAACAGVTLSLWSQQTILGLAPYASGFTRPVDIVNAGDDRLFVVEQRGIIKIINGQGQVLATPFLNIDPRVNSGANERGLLGLTFHPDYAENGYFYVNYTNNSGHTHISRFSVSADNPNVANPDSELTLFVINQPYSNHNAGDLNFGPDGYLYIGMGDGGSGGDPQNYSQNRLSLLGKMLRIDVDADSLYAIPPTNPFINTEGIRPEVWAIGLRNPWRFSFDRLTGDLWIGDVGQNEWEEIDFQRANSPGGENYGWRCYEGFEAYNTSGCGPISDYTPPIHTYATGSTQGCSVTGGYVYRGEAFPNLQGLYIYTDYCSGRIWTIRPDGQGGWINEQRLQATNQELSSFGEDLDGELYVSSLNTGNIYRVIDRCETIVASASVQPETCPGALNGIIDLNLAGVPPYTFAWSNEQLADSLAVYLTAGEYSVTVTDSRGCTVTRSYLVPGAVVDPPVITANGAELSATPDFATYQWLLGGEPIPGANSATHTALVSGVYTVQGTTADGCSAVSEGVSVEVTRTAEPLALYDLRVSPNPFGHTLSIAFTAPEPGEYRWQLTGLDGRSLRQGVVVAAPAVAETLPLNNLPAGNYLLRLSRNGKEQVVKVQKQ